MTMRMGAAIVDVLERSARRYLNSEGYDAFLFQLEGSGALRRYDASEAYWERVQTLLDGFFTSAQRAAVCEELMADGALRQRPEFRRFLARALAERRMQSLIQAAMLAERAMDSRAGKRLA